MALFGFQKTKKIVGLDIGSFALKLVELKPIKKGKETRYELVSLGYEPVPYQAIVEGSIMDSTAVVDAIQHVFFENKVKTNRLAFALSGSSVIVKRIEVQRLNPDEMHEHILWEARPHIPFTPDEVNIDYEIIESPDIHPDKVGVILSAVRKEKLNDYLHLISSAKKEAGVVDLDTFATLNSVLLNYEMYRDKSIAIINIGASITNVVISRGGHPIFVRDIAFGGNQFTDLLQKELNLKYEKAEMVKKGRMIDGISPAAVKPVLSIVLNDLKNEIKKTFEFYRSNTTEGRLDNILLAGGSANLETITDFFSQEFDIPVEIVNPFANIDINYKKFDMNFIKDMAPVYTVAVGLALRSSGDSK
ncbi:MAG TPA: type IV pilus assembly protein PilM [Candidatus Aminicenantes bacterium]|nr:type IV pilus assembly protein PilM [Candidatus Aminicenantes bacterium]